MPPSRAKANIILELLVCQVLLVTIRCDGKGALYQAEKTTVPNAQHDEYHEYQTSAFTTGVRQYLQDGQWARTDRIEVLDRE